MAGYFVDNSVVGPGTGTIGDPWDDVSSNLASLSPGDTMYVRVGTGTYNEGTVSIAVSGTSGNPITIAHYPSDGAVTWQDGAGDRTFDISGDYITIDGFEFDKQSHNRQAIRVQSGADHVTIRNCEIYDGDYITLVEVQGDDCTIEDCTIHDNDNGPNNDAHGILFGDCSNMVIQRCEIYDCYGDCIHVYNAWGTVFNYQILDNTLYTNAGSPPQGCTENGIDVKDGSGSYQDVIRGNTIYGFRDCDGSCGGTGASGEAIVLHDDADNILVEDNLIYDCETGVRILSACNDVIIQRNVFRDLVAVATWPETAIYTQNRTGIIVRNNTFDDCPNYWLRIDRGDITLTNNIFNDCNDEEELNGPTVTASHNCWWGTITTVPGTGDVNADPLFVNEAGNNFELTSPSPCIDAGTFVGLPYNGSAPDIGAFEWAGGPPPQSESPVTAPGPFGPALGMPPYTPTSHETQGLAILAYAPTIGSYSPRGVLIDGALGQKHTAYTHTTQALGGWWSGRLTLNGALVDMEDWFANGLGRHVEVWNPALVQVWGGFVNGVTLSAGTLTATRGPLLDIANRLSVTYTPILDATTNPPTMGSQTTTTITEDDDSQARYGIIEQVLNGGQLLDDGVTDLADEWQATYLADNAWPKTSEELGLGSTSEPVVELDLLGYVHWFGAYILDDATAATVTVSNQAGTGKLQLIIAADPNSLFSTDYSQMQDNALLTSRYEQDNRDAWTAIQELVKLGDGSNNRTLFGVYANQRIKYNTMPTTVKYQHRIADRDIQIEPYGGGAEIKPWDVQPGEWALLPDFLAGRSTPATMRRDPRYVFIESVTFTAPYQVQVRGGNVDTITQLIAKGGMWG